MKAYLRELIAATPNKLEATHVVREYLQARILQSLQRARAMQTLAFHGGTSLRFLFDIPRYSEDLDFALELNREAYDFRKFLQQIVKDFSAEAYEVDVKLNDKRVVHKAFIRFRGLLYELGLSVHETEVLSIKIEINTNPPLGATLATTPIYKYVPTNLHHHDRATLLAGKLHAILNRAYIKGRDWYDLWWYLNQADWPLPNFTHLNSSLRQTNSPLPLLTADNWKPILRERILALNWTTVLNDVEPFIIEKATQADFSLATLLASFELFRS
ncbi:MAG: nucleotidyl transferase AbiEii/AbiGii toxin family protein [Chloroflexota bacterium]